MKRLIKKGDRVVVNGNLQPYALARVSGFMFDEFDRTRQGLVLEWPNAPGGADKSRVWIDDEGKTWERYEDVAAALPN